MEEREQFLPSSPQGIHLLPTNLPPALSCLHLITLGWSAYLLFQPQPLPLSLSHGAVNVSTHPVDHLVPCYPPAPVLEACRVSGVSTWTHFFFQPVHLTPCFSLLRAPSSAMPFCLFSPLLPHGYIKGKHLPAQRYLPFHILLRDLPLSDLCCWNPLS